MPHAYVLLNADGTVARVHSPAIGGSATTTSPIPGTPTSAAADLETLLNSSFRPMRETPLEGGRVLLVLQFP